MAARCCAPSSKNIRDIADPWFQAIASDAREYVTLHLEDRLYSVTSIDGCTVSGVVLAALYRRSEIVYLLCRELISEYYAAQSLAISVINEDGRLFHGVLSLLREIYTDARSFEHVIHMATYGCISPCNIKLKQSLSEFARNYLSPGFQSLARLLLCHTVVFKKQAKLVSAVQVDDAICHALSFLKCSASSDSSDSQDTGSQVAQLSDNALSKAASSETVDEELLLLVAVIVSFFLDVSVKTSVFISQRTYSFVCSCAQLGDLLNFDAEHPILSVVGNAIAKAIDAKRSVTDCGDVLAAFSGVAAFQNSNESKDRSSDNLTLHNVNYETLPVEIDLLFKGIADGNSSVQPPGWAPDGAYSFTSTVVDILEVGTNYAEVSRLCSTITKHDDLSTLLRVACLFGSEEVVVYLSASWDSFHDAIRTTDLFGCNLLSYLAVSPQRIPFLYEAASLVGERDSYTIIPGSGASKHGILEFIHSLKTTRVVEGKRGIFQHLSYTVSCLPSSYYILFHTNDIYTTRLSGLFTTAVHECLCGTITADTLCNSIENAYAGGLSANPEQSPPSSSLANILIDAYLQELVSCDADVSGGRCLTSSVARLLESMYPDLCAKFMRSCEARFSQPLFELLSRRKINRNLATILSSCALNATETSDEHAADLQKEYRQIVVTLVSQHWRQLHMVRRLNVSSLHSLVENISTESFINEPSCLSYHLLQFQRDVLPAISVFNSLYSAVVSFESKLAQKNSEQMSRFHFASRKAFLGICGRTVSDAEFLHHLETTVSIKLLLVESQMANMTGSGVGDFDVTRYFDPLDVFLLNYFYPR